MSWKGKKIVLGVCGSIAAYKSVYLVRELIKTGALVRVVMTEAATDFVAPLTFSTLSKNECLIQFQNDENAVWNNHVELGLWADAIIIAPATANTLFKMANGGCDSLLLAVYLSARCPVFVAPAMDEDMWKHQSTQNNLRKLESFGNILIPVGNGELASGLVGPGRMAEVDEIMDFVSKNLGQKKKSKLKGKKILITAGPTYEPLDPVRFIGNHSSGKMGLAIAKAAKMRGAEVNLVLGPCNLHLPNDINIDRVTTGAEMLMACQKYFETTDVTIFSAAVADYTPTQKADQKIKKSGNELNLTLKKTADIALTFGRSKRTDQISVGFALETEKELTHAQKKLEKKNFDLIVLNSLNDKGAGFKSDSNKVTIIDRQNNIQKYELKSKQLVAVDILDQIEELI